jgi:hypothetical protein
MRLRVARRRRSRSSVHNVLRRFVGHSHVAHPLVQLLHDFRFRNALPRNLLAVVAIFGREETPKQLVSKDISRSTESEVNQCLDVRIELFPPVFGQLVVDLVPVDRSGHVGQYPFWRRPVLFSPCRPTSLERKGVKERDLELVKVIVGPVER